jgi:polyribonucleotide nucleotidyltransferase
MGAINMKGRFGASEIQFETGKLAKLTNSVMVTMGETVVLVTSTGASSARPGTDFLPLTCEFIEKKYSAGKIPGGYHKRETRPGPDEILNARLIDRPMRPLFPKTWRADIQIIATVLSFDQENDPAICAIAGASAATCISAIPFDGPMAGCRVCLIDGEYVINPTYAEQENAKLNLIVAATADAVTMVEGEGAEASEEEMLDAILAAHEAIKPIIKLQTKLANKVGLEKLVAEPSFIDATLYEKVVDLSIEELDATLPNDNKAERKASLKAITKSVISTIIEEDESYTGRENEISEYIDDVYRSVVRTRVVETRERMDGRRLNEIRPIWCETDTLPRTHGSAVFTRGETQALATVTLGTKRDEQRIDALTGDYFERFMLHYNFPPFCTGESKPLRGTSRREIGHGNLATRGVRAILPTPEDFSYTIRLVSEVLESNGSSSMATVCSSSMALMAAGVPTTKQVAGIAMGLIEEDGKVAVLSDILGDEDHLGDMDFKVVGTREGITAIQMDIKIKGLKRSILEQALEQARKGRLHILKEMDKCIKKPRKELGQYSPRIVHVQVSPDRVRDVIGPGGRVIRGLSEQSGCAIEVADDGTVTISGVGEESVNKAKFLIEQLTQEPEAGQDYEGVVKSIVDFGLFVEIIPGQEGLLHVSEIGTPRGSDLNDFFEVGDEINVRCTEVNNGKIRLTIKDVDGNGDQFDNIQSQSGPKAEIGGQYEGTVKRVMDYGIFVSFAGTDGLAHHSRIHGVARHEISSTFAEGDDVEVTVQEITSEGKISLSIGELDEDVDEVKPERSARKERPARKERKERDERDERSDRKERKPRKEPEVQEEYDDDEDLEIQVGGIYLGTVTNLKAYGCFVELAEGVTGLVHLQELADYPFDNIEEVVDIGEEIYVKVIDISRDGKIRLSRKEAVHED